MSQLRQGVTLFVASRNVRWAWSTVFVLLTVRSTFIIYWLGWFAQTLIRRLPERIAVLSTRLTLSLRSTSLMIECV